MAKRSMLVSLGWTLRDYAKRVWDNSGEDNVLFLAGGIAFNLLLAALPFILLLVAGVTLLLPVLYRGTINSQQAVADFLDRILPTHAETLDSPYHKLISDLLRTRNTITLYSAIGFIWFRPVCSARCARCWRAYLTSTTNAGSSPARSST